MRQRMYWIPKIIFFLKKNKIKIKKYCLIDLSLKARKKKVFKLIQDKQSQVSQTEFYGISFNKKDVSPKKFPSFLQFEIRFMHYMIIHWDSLKNRL